jgi:hypothetical protein
MDGGRAVEGRRASPSVCLAAPLLIGSPKAFLTKNSFRVIAFLPGSAQNVECDVTSTKQTTGEFLPGARTGQCRAQISIAKPLSNRELRLLESSLTQRKQTVALRSNRELSTNPRFRNSRSPGSLLLALTREGSRTTSRPFALPPEGSVLTETGSHSEIAVTHSKQTTATFLTGARTHINDFDFARDSAAPTPTRFATLRSRRRPTAPIGRLAVPGETCGACEPVPMDRSCRIERRGREARGCEGGKRIGS